MNLDKAGNWKAFYVVLALLVNGIALFPNLDNFVDHLDMRIFHSSNPIPFSPR